MHYDLDVLGKKVKITLRQISKFIQTTNHHLSDLLPRIVNVLNEKDLLMYFTQFPL